MNQNPEKNTKKPTNRNSLPRIIISNFDENSIKELKVHFEKLGRLDIFKIEKMSFTQDNSMQFETVFFNGKPYEIKKANTLEINIEGKQYLIRGKIQKSNQTILKLLNTKEKNKKAFTYKVIEENGMILNLDGSSFELKAHLKKESTRKVNDKYIINLEAPNFKDNETRSSSTEREIITKSTQTLFHRINTNNKLSCTSQELYKMKRFLSYRSDLLFFYNFINGFFEIFPKSKNHGKSKDEKFYELWQIKLDVNNKEKYINYIKTLINDTLKNSSDTKEHQGKLSDYIKNDTLIEEDFYKIQKTFSALRHSLMHYDYKLFEQLFNNSKIEAFELDINFLDIIIDNAEDLQVESRKNYLKDEEVNFFGKDYKLQRLYTFYIRIGFDRVGLNRLINSFFSKDGVENQILKELINEYAKKHNKETYQELGNVAYYEDIHSFKTYKKLYNEHKKLIIQKEYEKNGQIIKQLNDSLQKYKEKMDKITKLNSLMRLEYKMRLAFGFMASEFKDFVTFKNNFKDNKLKELDKKEFAENDFRHYLEKTYQKSDFITYTKTIKQKNKKPYDKELNIFSDYEKLSLKNLIKDEPFLKFILLMYCFMPHEIKGEFLGFVLKLYHQIKNIEHDTKDEEINIENSNISLPLKLKILGRNIKAFTPFNYLLTQKWEYIKNEKTFYQKGSELNSIYSNLRISHNKEEFNKSFLTPLLRYYSYIFKLINDLEVYILLKYHSSDSLSTILDKKPFHFRWDNNKKDYVSTDYYNFSSVLNKGFPHKKSWEYKAIKEIRNSIAHLDFKQLFLVPFMLKDKKDRSLIKLREESINFISNIDDFKEILGFDALNDFIMKTIQLQKKLAVYSNKQDSIDKLSKEIKTANDFYNLYKLKGVEAINQRIKETIGELDIEKSIKNTISEGNKKYSKADKDE